MPRLHYSNHLESLIIPLAKELDKRDPLDCVDIVVPNYSLEKWIPLKVAQINGIAANLRFINLEKAIFEGIQEIIKGKKYDLLKKETLQCLVLEILREKLENSDLIWTPIKNYLAPEKNINPEAIEQRLFQLSKRLTNLFQEYEFSRNKELINNWIIGNNSTTFSRESSESWQKEIWNEIFGPRGKITNFNENIRKSSESISQPELYTLNQLSQICESILKQKNYTIDFGRGKSSIKVLHIFGVSYLSKFHQKALTEHLSIFREINVYSLNPCMEFWEDVKSLGESKTEILKKIESRKNLFSREKNFSEKEIMIGEEIQIEEDNPFLEAWGRPGRENIRLLNQWSNWDFTHWFVESTSKNQSNLLRQIQQDILFREPRRAKPLGMKQDESLMVLACPSPKREVEAVASLIWEWVSKEPDIMLNECAVIANNMEIYQHEIEQIFEGIYNLPYHLIDGENIIASQLGDAANLLLGLCFTEYTRKDLFNLIKNPFFVGIFEDNLIDNIARRGESLNTEKWMQWADELNIFYGINRKWYEKQGYIHIDGDKYSWEQAFNRLNLGDMLCSSADTDFFSIENKQIVPAEIPQEWSIEAARFFLIIKSLIEDTRYMQKWEMKAKDWACYLDILIKTYLKPTGTDSEEVFQILLRNTQAISELDLGQKSEHLFRFNTILEFFKERQSSVNMHRGHYLAEGITISSFKPMRPIPFKAVFLLGLGEGLFPSNFKNDTLDLRRVPEKLSPPIEGRNFRERRIGDVSETERDRYMFLETLISTRNHLVLSYVSHNQRNDEKLNPSSIIQTLLDELNRGYLKNKFEETYHPLKPYSLKYFPELNNLEKNKSKKINKLPNYNFSSFRQARSFRLREIFKKKFPDFERISLEILAPQLRKIFENNFLNQKKIIPESENVFILSFSNIRKFLETPLQSSIGEIISFNEEKDDIYSKIEEPFILNRLEEWSLLRKIWNHALEIKSDNIKLNKKPEWGNLYLKFSKHIELEGLLPLGIFKKTMYEKHVRILKNWEKQLTEILKIDWKTLQRNMYRFHFGPLKDGVFNYDIPKNQILNPAISINYSKNNFLHIDQFGLKIKGSSEWWYKDKKSNWYVIYFSEKAIKEKTWIRHFLDIIILLISGVIKDYSNVSGICIGPKDCIKLKKIKIPTLNEAQKYIFNLIHDMKNENTAEIMPIESVLELSQENLDETAYNIRFNNWIEEKMSLNKKNMNISTKYGPVDFLEDFSLPKNPYKIKNRRFDLFFKTILN